MCIPKSWTHQQNIFSTNMKPCSVLPGWALAAQQGSLQETYDVEEGFFFSQHLAEQYISYLSLDNKYRTN